jgi:hypothetical protein
LRKQQNQLTLSGRLNSRVGPPPLRMPACPQNDALWSRSLPQMTLTIFLYIACKIQKFML